MTATWKEKPSSLQCSKESASANTSVTRSLSEFYTEFHALLASGSRLGRSRPKFTHSSAFSQFHECKHSTIDAEKKKNPYRKTVILHYI